MFLLSQGQHNIEGLDHNCALFCQSLCSCSCSSFWFYCRFTVMRLGKVIRSVFSPWSASLAKERLESGVQSGQPTECAYSCKTRLTAHRERLVCGDAGLQRSETISSFSRPVLSRPVKALCWFVAGLSHAS